MSQLLIFTKCSTALRSVEKLTYIKPQALVNIPEERDLILPCNIQRVDWTTQFNFLKNFASHVIQAAQGYSVQGKS